MRKTANVSSIYGPIKVELFLCDGPNCSHCNQEDHMVNWLRLSHQGIQALTYSQSPDDMDFCSLECLGKALDAMRGIPEQEAPNA